MTLSDNSQFKVACPVRGGVTEVRDEAIGSKCIPVDYTILIDHSIALPQLVILTIVLQWYVAIGLLSYGVIEL